MGAPTDDIRQAPDLGLRSARGVTRVRCVLRFQERYLFVRHKSWHKRNSKKWALPGGRVKPGECPADAIRREIAEEIHLDLRDYVDLVDYEQGGEIHRLYGCDLAEAVRTFDTDEISQTQWFTRSEVIELASAGRLHRGFELPAINAYARKTRRRSPIGTATPRH